MPPTPTEPGWTQAARSRTSSSTPAPSSGTRSARPRRRPACATARYSFSLTLPKDFSAALLSSGEFQPRQGQLTVTTNDANNYLVGTIADRVVGEVRNSVATEVGTDAADKFLVGFGTIYGKTQDAANGASQLADGAGKARDGAAQLAAGQNQLLTGAARLESGTATAAQGASTLSSGLNTLQDKTKDLPSQTSRLADGAKQVADGNEQDRAEGRAGGRRGAGVRERPGPARQPTWPNGCLRPACPRSRCSR